MESVKQLQALGWEEEQITRPSCPSARLVVIQRRSHLVEKKSKLQGHLVGRPRKFPGPRAHQHNQTMGNSERERDVVEGSRRAFVKSKPPSPLRFFSALHRRRHAPLNQCIRQRLKDLLHRSTTGSRAFRLPCLDHGLMPFGICMCTPHPGDTPTQGFWSSDDLACMIYPNEPWPTESANQLGFHARQERRQTRKAFLPIVREIVKDLHPQYEAMLFRDRRAPASPGRSIPNLHPKAVAVLADVFKLPLSQLGTDLYARVAHVRIERRRSFPNRVLRGTAGFSGYRACLAPYTEMRCCSAPVCPLQKCPFLHQARRLSREGHKPPL
jgi:hypothetical protein